jgi:hypothetical protein
MRWARSPNAATRSRPRRCSTPADPARSPVALALGRVAVRNPSFLLDALGTTGDLDGAVLVLRDAFDMLEEDFDEERFYVSVRRAYWQAPQGSETRTIGNKLITVLEF